MDDQFDYDEFVRKAINAEIEAIMIGLSQEYKRISENPYILAAGTSATSALILALAIPSMYNIGILSGVVAVMGASTGVGGLAMGLAELITAATTDRGSFQRMHDIASLGLDYTSNPPSLILGTIGSVVSKDSNLGFKTGVELGKLISGVHDTFQGINEILSKDVFGEVDIISGLISLQAVEYSVLLQAIQTPRFSASRSSSDNPSRHSQTASTQRERNLSEDINTENALREAHMSAITKIIAQREQENRNQVDRNRIEKQKTELNQYNIYKSISKNAENAADQARKRAGASPTPQAQQEAQDASTRAAAAKDIKNIYGQAIGFGWGGEAGDDDYFDSPSPEDSIMVIP